MMYINGTVEVLWCVLVILLVIEFFLRKWNEEEAFLAYEWGRIWDEMDEMQGDINFIHNYLSQPMVLIKNTTSPHDLGSSANKPCCEGAKEMEKEKEKEDPAKVPVTARPSEVMGPRDLTPVIPIAKCLKGVKKKVSRNTKGLLDKTARRKDEY